MSANPIKNDFTRMTINFAFVQLAILVLFGGVSVFFNDYIQQRLARQVSNTLRELLVVGDLRYAIVSLQSSLNEDFEAVAYFSSDEKLVFSIPSNAPTYFYSQPSLREEWLTKRWVVPIRFAQSSDKISGTLKFVYKRFALFPAAVALWLFTLICTLPFIFRARRRLTQRYHELAERRRLESLKALASQFAHDIRSPLMALQVATDGMEIPDPQIKRMIQMSLGRLRDISKDVLSRHLKQGANALMPTNILFTLEDIVRETSMALPAEIKIVRAYGTSASLSFCLIDRSELARVLSNILKNAIEAIEMRGTAENGQITLSLDCAENQIHLSVRDNGIGMPQSLLEKLFREGMTYGKSGGSGLGLFHAKAAIEKARGTISVSSKEGEGSVFTLFLPREELPTPFKIQIPKARQILAVDDDAQVLEFWRDKLSAGQLKTAQTQHELEQAMLTAREYELFLVDQDLQGFEVNGLEWIKANRLSSQSVLVTSRYDSQELIEECRQLKIAIIPKPWLPWVIVRA